MPDQLATTTQQEEGGGGANNATLHSCRPDDAEAQGAIRRCLVAQLRPAGRVVRRAVLAALLRAADRPSAS